MRTQVAALALALCAVPAMASGTEISAPAAAPPVPPVQLAISDCIEVDHTETVRLFAMELRSQPIDGKSGAAKATKAQVACTATGAFELRVDDPVTGKTLARSIDIRQFPPETRPRLLALALVELIIAAWSELVVVPAPSAALARDESMEQARRAAGITVKNLMPVEPDRFTLRLTALGAAEKYWGGTDGLYGGGFCIAGDHGPLLGWSADLLFMHGGASAGAGSVSVESVDAAVAATIRRPVSYLTLRGGLGFRGGTVWMTGSPADAAHASGRTIAGPFFGPMATAGFDVGPWRWVTIELRGTGGYVVLPVSGQSAGKRAAAVDGWWTGAMLGLGVSL